MNFDQLLNKVLYEADDKDEQPSVCSECKSKMELIGGRMVCPECGPEPMAIFTKGALPKQGGAA
jgi:predicted amidophosphoribosyltransferase